MSGTDCTEHEPDPGQERCLTAHLTLEGECLPACYRCKRCRRWCRLDGRDGHAARGRAVVVPGVELEGLSDEERDRAMARWLFGGRES